MPSRQPECCLSSCKWSDHVGLLPCMLLHIQPETLPLLERPNLAICPRLKLNRILDLGPTICVTVPCGVFLPVSIPCYIKLHKLGFYLSTSVTNSDLIWSLGVQFSVSYPTSCRRSPSVGYHLSWCVH